MFFRHAQAGSGGFFPECFFDELGDKICLLHLLPLSWLTKDSPFDSVCRLFLSSLPGAVLYGGSTLLPTLVPRFPGKWPGRRHANPHRPAGPLSIVPLLVASMKVRRTPSSCARSVTSSASSRMTSDEKPAVNIGCTTWKDSMPWRKPPYTAS